MRASSTSHEHAYGRGAHPHLSNSCKIFHGSNNGLSEALLWRGFVSLRGGRAREEGSSSNSQSTTAAHYNSAVSSSRGP